MDSPSLGTIHEHHTCTCSAKIRRMRSPRVLGARIGPARALSTATVPATTGFRFPEPYGFSGRKICMTLRTHHGYVEEWSRKEDYLNNSSWHTSSGTIKKELQQEVRPNMF